MSEKKPWPPEWLICRCGAPFKIDEPHMCMPKQNRPPGMYSRWIYAPKETTRELYRLGGDPLFAPENQQQGLRLLPGGSHDE